MKSIILLLVLLAAGMIGRAQDPGPVEKVYLQLDKPYYAAGDDLWFKAYVVSGSAHRLPSISGVLNVELLDGRDSVKQGIKLKLDSGMARGDFALPDTLRAGNYRIRAYTNYMRNAGDAHFFNAPLTIIHRGHSVKAMTGAGGSIDLQFFPESGYLVNGIRSKVAFKAISPNGLGTAISGVIKNAQGRQVAQFAASHLGMGEFELTPVPGETYHAEFGAEKTVPLPLAAAQGQVLKVSQTAKNLTIEIEGTRAAGAFTLVGQSGGKECFVRQVDLTSPFVLHQSTAALPSGILQLTLISPSGEPLNERLVFIQNEDQLKLAITTDQSHYATRQKVHLNVEVKNADHQPVAGHFSVSVTDETKVPVEESSENNILASLLLSSELRGNIEQPAYYFNHPNADLDVLMLTQGYHRFAWKALFEPEKSLSVTGSVLTAGGKPVANAKVTLYDLDSIQFTRETLTNAQGRFAFRGLSFDDSVRFIVQARTDKNKRNVDIKIDQPLPVSASTNKELLSASDAAVYAAQPPYGPGNHIFTLSEVVIREKKELLKSSSNLNGPGNADQIVLGRTLREQGCLNISDCLEGRLLGVTFHRGIPYSTRDNRPMQLIVDGAYLEGSYLNTLNYTDVKGIEVLRNIGYTAIYGSRGGSGVMIVTTRRGNEDEDAPAPIYGRGITTTYPKGYYKAREFYSPRYGEPQTDKQLADLRTTIYWNPNLNAGADGKAHLDYFNAGSKGTYRVVIEGIGAGGELARQVFRYQVE